MRMFSQIICILNCLTSMSRIQKFLLGLAIAGLTGAGCGDSLADAIFGDDKGDELCQEYMNTCPQSKRAEFSSSTDFGSDCDASMRLANQKGCGEKLRAFYRCAIKLCNNEVDSCESKKSSANQCKR